MTNEETGRLILQAHSGAHGNVAKKLADALVEKLAEIEDLNGIIVQMRQQEIDDEPHEVTESAVEPQSPQPQSA